METAAPAAVLVLVEVLRAFDGLRVAAARRLEERLDVALGRRHGGVLLLRRLLGRHDAAAVLLLCCAPERASDEWWPFARRRVI